MVTKKKYVTEKNIDIVSEELLSVVGRRSADVSDLFDPLHSCLLIVDMQKYFLSKDSHAFIPSSEAIIPGINTLVKKFYEKNLKVLFTRNINSPENAGMMSRWWKDLITENAPLSHIDERISRYDYPIIEKTQYDAFYNTDLEDHLKSNDVTQLIICGVMTHLCCETTARSAFVHGFETFFPVDGSATYNKDFHTASLRNLSHGFARLCKISELIEALDEKH